MNESETQTHETSENSETESSREETANNNPENEYESRETPEIADTRIELVKAETLAEGDLPEPSEHVIREHVPGIPQIEPSEPAKLEEPEMPESLEETKRGWRDPSGRYFDPEKHQHTNGFPETSAKGYLRPWSRAHEEAGLPMRAEGLAGFSEPEPERKGSLLDRAKRFFTGEPETERKIEPETREPAPEVRPQAAQYPNGGLIGLPEIPRDSQSAKVESEAEIAAAQLVAMEEMIAVMIFSEEWQFLSEERKGLVKAWTRTFEEKGVVETPWWMELGAAHAVIFANRADKPKTREKLGKMKASIMKKVIDFRTAHAPAKIREEER